MGQLPSSQLESVAPASDSHTDIEKVRNISIPERVVSPFTLQISPSILPGSGRGIFIAGEHLIPGNEVIFSIKRPLFNVVNGGAALHQVCHNCFAAKSDGHYTVVREREHQVPRFYEATKCPTCHVTYYCSRECQEAARADHEAECMSFLAISQKYESKEAQMLLRSPYVRFALRIVDQEFSGEIRLQVWSEIMKMAVNTAGLENLDNRTVTTAEVAAKLSNSLIPTSLSLEVIKDLVYKLYLKGIPMHIPLHRGSRTYDPKVLGTTVNFQTHVKAGRTLDPFMALLSHECNPTAYIVRGGYGEIEVRATKNLVPGDEVTISYVDRSEDVPLRKEALRKLGIECVCKFCKDNLPASLPEGDFRTKVLKLFPNSSTIEKGVTSKRELETVIADIEKNHGYDVFPLSQLYDLVIVYYLRKGRTSDALKTILKQHYLCKPVDVQKDSDTRINQLYILLSILNCPLPGTSVLQELPKEVQNFNLHSLFILQLRANLVAMTKKYYGEESEVARFEEKYFVELLKSWDTPKRTLELARVRESFIGKMNKLLVWADIPTLTEEQFLT